VTAVRDRVCRWEDGEVYFEPSDVAGGFPPIW